MHADKSNSSPAVAQSDRQPPQSQIPWSAMKCLGLPSMIGGFCLAAALGTAAADANSASLRPLTTAELLHTTAAGTYRLSPALTGKCAVVFATGVFRQAEPALFATNRYKLKFDTAVVTAKRTIANVGRHGIARVEKDGGFSALHSHRDSLPDDSAIQSASRIGGLEKLLGASHDLPGAPRRAWRYFSMSKDGSTDTLQVTAVIASDDRIESLEIVRGETRPDVKPEKEN
jgi:hypothetical protein